ncbi:MAG: hypothetical protein U0R52_00895 [Solirubrobacterales bacterium]
MSLNICQPPLPLWRELAGGIRLPSALERLGELGFEVLEFRDLLLGIGLRRALANVCVHLHANCSEFVSCGALGRRDWFPSLLATNPGIIGDRV